MNYMRGGASYSVPMECEVPNQVNLHNLILKTHCLTDIEQRCCYSVDSVQYDRICIDSINPVPNSLTHWGMWMTSSQMGYAFT